MARRSEKVVWFEGMTLDPHHMQQWDRHQQAALDARAKALSPHGWGLIALAIDRERLANGELALTEAAGVLPDGFAFDMPGADVLPSPRDVQPHFDTSEEHLPVFLALPAEQPGRANYTLQGLPSQGSPPQGTALQNGTNNTRFSTTTASIPDATTGGDEREIEVAQANFQLRFSSEPLDTFTTLQVAELERTGTGFALREDFVPPCLRLEASAWLLSTTRQLLELLVAKSEAFRERKEHVLSQRELSPADVAALGLLATVNTHVPLLSDFLHNTERHPEVLFRSLLALAGGLSAHLSEAPAPRHFPSYRHEAPSECFRPLSEVLHDMLGEASPQANYTRVELRTARDNLFVADVSQRQIENAQFFLVVRSDQMSEQQIVSAVGEQLRVASAETIDAVLRSYTRALSVEHTARLPVGLPVDPQAHYFRLKKRGPFWEAIEDTGQLALFVPSDLQPLSFELVTVENP